MFSDSRNKCRLSANSFLTVETNVGYQPTAVFITQYETQQAISEALNIVRNGTHK